MKQERNTFKANGFGKIAPWVDLVNSEEWDGFGKLTDQLENPRWLATFLKHWELYPFSEKNVPRSKLTQLRSVLRRVAEKAATGGALSRADLARLNRILNVPVWQRLVQHQNGFRTETVPVRSDWEWVPARIVASFGEMLANRELDRIRVCANTDCRWVFHDSTKARTKRWCNDRTCGNRARVRRARELQKQKA
jgi:predicted RNA-binding Zn ribbon-like protein